MHELEFLPEDYLRARFQRRIGFIRSWLLLAIGLAMVLWSLQMGAWVRDVRADLAAVRGAGSAMDADVKKVRSLRAEARSHNQRLDLVRSLRSGIAVTDVIAEVVRLLPSCVGLESLDLDHPMGAEPERATLRLCGWAPDEMVVTQALGQLDASPRFERAILVRSKLLSGDAGGRRSFIIEAGVLPRCTAEER
ncbi:MAG TPA: hypothetical protein VM238_19380 [Phycisphaerae bacterium]|nr:hypothetical protein [Phycisphaerae bacterium]